MINKSIVTAFFLLCSTTFIPASDAQISPRSGMAQVFHGQQSAAGTETNIHHLANSASFDNILKLTNPVIDPDRRRLYVCGTLSTAIGVIDLDTDRMLETFDVGIDVPCGYLLIDRSRQMLYSVELGGGNRIFEINIAKKKAEQKSSLPSSVILPKRRQPKIYNGMSYTETGYPFEVGYMQNANASYGVIEIRDLKGRKTGAIEHGPDALYFDIDDRTGKLYATNTGDGSISVFDLNNGNRKIRNIDIGTSIDEIALNPATHDLYIRNRLGGSTLFSYDPAAGTVKKILNENTAGDRGIGMWPTKMILDQGKLYVLSHYGMRIDVIDAATHNVLKRIPLSLSYKPRTDGLSTMTMDRTHKLLYAAFPELGEIAVADARTGKWLKTITIRDFDKTRMSPVRIELAVDERRSRLLAYLSYEKILKLYQAPFYSEETKSALGGQTVERISGVNVGKDVLYMGNRAVDLETFETRNVFSKGSRVVGFNNDNNRVYIVDTLRRGPRSMVERVNEYEGTTLTKQWTLSPSRSIPSSFAFDFEKNRFYAGHFESAVVEEFDLSAGETPVDSDSELRPEQSRGAKGVRGRCGDGICQPVEREKGVCPDDCASGDGSAVSDAAYRPEQPRQGGPSGGVRGRCGDGICQPIESERGVCPDDCK